jgi:hypothetical protein
MPKDRHRTLLAQRTRALAELPDMEQILRGTLRRRYVRCGKPGCHCEKGRGHGPVSYLSTSLDGQTQQITIAPPDYAAAKQYVRNYERLWCVLERICALNRELLRQRLLTPEPESPPPKKPPHRKSSGT